MFISMKSEWTTMPCEIPRGYFVEHRTGRRQPFTVWREFDGGKKKRKVCEVVAFCLTWYEALCRIRDDDPEGETNFEK